MFRLLNRQAVKTVRRPGLVLSSGTTTSRHVHKPDPLAYFSEKRQQEALQRGEFTDIHDIPPEGGFYPDEYDLLLTDISHETLEHRISEEFGIAYLSEATDEAKKPVSMDTGSPWTYISRQASEKFGLDWNPEEAALAMIGGHVSPLHLSPPSSRFADVNVLGTDFCEFQHASMWHDYTRHRVKLFIGGASKVVADESKFCGARKTGGIGIGFFSPASTIY